ncbi:hypothetical protein HDU96_007780 [Phlyctochytrium bullatum]|nr:hypothetical protein HDU96_007780 [Phlyctochytrium bullatum]
MLWIADATLRKVLATTGLFVAPYIALHFNGHSLAILRFSLANWSLLKLRQIVQFPPVELTLATAALVHVTAGFLLATKRTARWLDDRRKKMERLKRERQLAEESRQAGGPSAARGVDELPPPEDEFVKKNDGDGSVKISWAQRTFGSVAWPSTLHRYAGYVVSVFLVTHLVGVRIGPLLWLKDPSSVDLTMVTLTLDTGHNLIPGVVFHIYYVLFSSFALYHTVYGLVRSFDLLESLRIRIRPPRVIPSKWNMIFLAIVGLSMMTVLAVGGWFQRVRIPKMHQFEQLENILLSIFPRMLRLDFGFLSLPRV